MLNFDFVLRLLVAGILGAIIGLDREYRAKEAGYRTHFLVSLGSALIMIVSQYGFQEIIKESSVTLDPSRVAAQVVSGIGFIGAGTIIFQKQIVRGLTTAAGIWATAGIGLAVGAGMYTISIAATLLTLAGLELLSLIFKSIGMKSSVGLSPGFRSSSSCACPLCSDIQFSAAHEPGHATGENVSYSKAGTKYFKHPYKKWIVCAGIPESESGCKKQGI